MVRVNISHTLCNRGLAIIMFAMRQSTYDADTHERYLAPEHGQRTAPRSAPPAARAPIRVTVTSAQVSTEDVGVYVISVAARLLDMHPQTLRKYERAGLVTPSRTEGLLRLYSDQDLNRLRMVKHLVDHWGMNLAGVEVALELLDRMLDMQQRLLPLVRTSDDATVVVREAWTQVVRALGLPDAAEADNQRDDASPQRGDHGDDSTQRQRARGVRAPGPARRR